MQRFLLVVCLGLVITISGTAVAEPVDFELEDIHGVKHRLSDYRGKWVVVNYWATWCPPCLDEIPELVDFHEEHKDKDAVVLGISFEEVGNKKLRHFTEEYFINYPILRSQPGPSGELGEIPGLPTTYLISPDGEIAARQVGSVTAKLIADFITAQAITTPPADDMLQTDDIPQTDNTSQAGNEAGQ
ncbi:MAG: TlpA family protein disulfide reductase [Gammaproteobacteria bacterium]|nr:TlpA family protein disulfide reductase [Gammaproteobacteria bacterium]MCF6361987.1 TlpA family protein disulfide reductase [Gammaproteobacteria bacterium]